MRGIRSGHFKRSAANWISAASKPRGGKWGYLGNHDPNLIFTDLARA
jgi:hypothetical protein